MCQSECHWGTRVTQRPSPYVRVLEGESQGMSHIMITVTHKATWEQEAIYNIMAVEAEKYS